MYCTSKLLNDYKEETFPILMKKELLNFPKLA